jgi:hypothetical protein
MPNAAPDTMDGLPEVTGSFEMLADPVLPLGAAGAWESGGHRAQVTGGGLALFAGLDSPFTDNYGCQHHSPSGWPTGGLGGGFFGTMPCDPAASFQTLAHSSLLASQSTMAGGGEGEMELVFPFPFSTHPVPDFPLED